jgi:hypothetical protein
MKKFIRECLSNEGMSRADISTVVNLAEDIGRLLDSYGGITFFALADALAQCSDRDARTEAIYKLACEANAIKTAESIESRVKSLRVVDEDQAD